MQKKCCNRVGLWLVLVLLSVWPCSRAEADNDPRAYDAVVFLLSQTTQPYRDGTHSRLLMGLRSLEDPGLAPLYEVLSASPHMPQRLHGRLGLAALSPAGRLDLAVAAVVDDPRELTGLLGASIDDGLLDTADLTQVVRWDALDMSARLALAVRIVAGGGAVDEQLLRQSLLAEEDAVDASKLLSHGLATLLLMERGDLSAAEKLNIIDRHEPARERDAVRAQLLEVAYRHGFISLSEWSLAMARDEGNELPLRLAGLRTALSFTEQAQGAAAVTQWRSMFAGTDDPAGRIRLALLALEAAHRTDPALFAPLVAEEDPYLRLIGDAGQAVADPARDALAPVLALIEHGHPLTVQWATWYARQHASPEERGPILAAVVASSTAGSPRTRARRVEYAIEAAQGLAELDLQAFETLLLPMLGPDGPAAPGRGELAPRHIVLLGLVRAQEVDLTQLAARLPPQADPDARDLVLMLRARWSRDLSDADWQRVSQIVAGASSFDPALRIQLGWFYLKHLGRTDEAIRAATTGG